MGGGVAGIVGFGVISEGCGLLRSSIKFEVSSPSCVAMKLED